VSRAPIEGISARNILPARVDSVAFDGDDASLETALSDDPSNTARLCVRLTRASARELALEPSARIHLVFKTQSCRVLSAPTA
jgi:molybdopterin-binding protein